MIALADIAAASRDVAATPARSAKIARIAELLRDAGPDEAAIAVSWLTGELLQGRIGIGPAAVRRALATPPAPAPALTAADVQEALADIGRLAGTGSAAARARMLEELFARASRDEQAFLARLLQGELRQGALQGIMADALARAAGLDAAHVRRAAQHAGDLPTIARAALTGGAEALGAFGVRLFRPLQPMLAQPAQDVDDAMRRLGRAALDYKLDGARVQVHRSGDDVRVYTRRLNDVTAAVPEIVAAALGMGGRDFVLDGEAIALSDDGRPRPFQVTMSRFGSRVDVERLRTTLPLSVFFFDCLYAGGRSMVEEKARDRFDALAGLVPAERIVPRTITADRAEAAAFMAAALAAGHEGIIAKDLDAAYDPGRRGGAWLKVKPADTLDLVVLAAEWGSGRRSGRLSNLHLGARDPVTGGFVMLGKTFKGLTDAMLEWQTAELLARATRREGHVVYVRPELVVEVAFEGVQDSPRYPAGVALRFARVRGYRPDKAAADADTIERVLALRST
ncbi:MAG TPA: ATP-dependent DNA ligase [Longimicrobiales bacterium]|nr:ATP-dependent DNA ligase [Longimicrobiales bacterium]